MYAVIKTGSKQYRVSVGDKVKVEKLGVAPSEEASFSPILVSDDNKIDLNDDKKWSVKAKILGEGKKKKVLVFHKKRRKQYKKLNGHRQLYSLIEITNIEKV